MVLQQRKMTNVTHDETVPETLLASREPTVRTLCSQDQYAELKVEGPVPAHRRYVSMSIDRC